MPAVKISPSILAADFASLGTEIAAVSSADYVHVDVMDGHFVPNITIGPPVVRAIKRFSTLPLDVHLMIDPPEPYLEAFASAGADIITVHAEVCPHLHRTLAAIRELGVRAGVSLNPSTPIDVVQHVLDQMDLLLVMTVNPGFGGQRFIDAMVPKIAAARAMIGDRPIELEVDGGITVHTAPVVIAAGANVLVAGSAVFGVSDRAAAITALRAASTDDPAR